MVSPHIAIAHGSGAIKTPPIFTSILHLRPPYPSRSKALSDQILLQLLLKPYLHPHILFFFSSSNLLLTPSFLQGRFIPSVPHSSTPLAPQHQNSRPASGASISCTVSESLNSSHRLRIFGIERSVPALGRKNSSLSASKGSLALIGRNY